MRSEGYACKHLVSNITILKETGKNEAIFTRSCKISAERMHSLARHFARILQEFHFFSTRKSHGFGKEAFRGNLLVIWQGVWQLFSLK